MKKLILVGLGLVLFAGAYWLLPARHAADTPSASSAAPFEDTTASPKALPIAPSRPIIPIPETAIILKRELQFKDAAGNIALVLPPGETLVAESTQGLEYIVVREGRTIRVHCGDAYEPHGRFTDGRAEHLALQMAQEIRAEGKAPTNERIVARATQALEDRKLEGDDLQTQVDNLQRALLLHH